MKQLKITLILLTVLLSVDAQKPSLSRAYNFYYDQNYVKAKEIIDLCIKDEKLSLKATTWLYKANIDYYLASNEYSERQKDDNYNIRFPQTPVEAYDAFKKAKELNKNVVATGMLSPDNALPQLYTLLFINGVDELIAQKYVEAKETLEKGIESYEMNKIPPYPLNGEIYYYYAYTLEMLKDKQNAIRNYEKAIIDSSRNANVYLRLIALHKEVNNNEAIYSTIDKGRKFLPNNPDIAVAEADYYFFTKDTVKAKEILYQLPIEHFDDINTIINVSNLFILDSNYTQAEKLLKKAYRQNQDNFVVLYNLGVTCYYISEQNFIKANQLQVQGNKNAAEPLKEVSDKYLEEAKNYFEQALHIQPDDLSVLNVLKAIYIRMDSPMYDETLKKIEQLENKK